MKIRWKFNARTFNEKGVATEGSLLVLSFLDAFVKVFVGITSLWLIVRVSIGA